MSWPAVIFWINLIWAIVVIIAIAAWSSAKTDKNTTELLKG